MIKRAVILQSSYIPWRGYFDLIREVDYFVFLDSVQYTQRDWRSRNRIYPKHGLRWLTVPISHIYHRAPLDEVKLLDPKWQEYHYKTLLHSYSQADCFNELLPLIKEFYLSRTWTSLSELNRYTIERLSRLMGINTPFLTSHQLHRSQDKIARLIEILKSIGANCYLSGPSGKDYLKGEEHQFEKEGIELQFKEYPSYPPYSQWDLPYEPFVSILDCIAHTGLSGPKEHFIQQKLFQQKSLPIELT